MPLPSMNIALCLLYTSAHAYPYSIWHVSIDESPAPPQNEGPPFSAHALRNKSKLAYEIIGIGGAYVLWVAVSAILILFIGRRLRRRKHLLNRNLHKPSVRSSVQQKHTIMNTGSGPRSPRSPGRLTSWISPGKGHKHQASHASASTVDERVLEADRARNMDDMAKLYAAVMQQDEEKAQQTQHQSYNGAPLHSPTNRPPELQYLSHDPSFVQPSSQSIATTAIEEDSRTAVASRASSRKTRTSPLSFLSQGHSRTDSANSNKSRPSRISFRGQPISHPVGSPDLRESAVYEEEMPLSPRVYTPGPPPLTPGQKSAAAQAREMERMDFHKPRVLAALSLQSAAATNSTSSLPFRQVYPESMQSAPATKTTFLEKRESLLHPAPKTGIPNIPYSPYMPYTPVTPITPRLVTKQELKRNKQKNAGILSPEDVVPNDEEMWQG